MLGSFEDNMNTYEGDKVCVVETATENTLSDKGLAYVIEVQVPEALGESEPAIVFVGNAGNRLRCAPTTSAPNMANPLAKATDVSGISYTVRSNVTPAEIYYRGTITLVCV